MATDTFIDKTISHFHILEKIGEGGMGRVYKALDTRLRRIVALKFISDDLLANKKILKQFQFEAIAASAINHPNICSIYDIIKTESSRFIVMEYIDGPTLRSVLDKHGKLSEWDTIWILKQICSPLILAHDAGIVHRDLKPDNFIIDENSHLLKITDFGLAKLAAENAELINIESLSVDRVENASQTLDRSILTLSGIMGTAAYMAPEQVRKQPVDNRSDIFVLGLIVYELLTGIKYFSGTTQIDVLEQIAHFEGFNDASEHVIPDRWNPILNSCLHPDPNQRYQTLTALMYDVEKIKQRTRPVNALYGNDEYSMSAIPRRVFQWGLLPLLAIVFIVISFLGIKQWSENVRGTSAENIVLADSIEVTTNSPEAYHYFIKGRQQWWRYASREATKNFQIAVEIDTSFSYAYCLLGLLLNWQDREKEAATCFEKSLYNFDNLSRWEQMLVRGFQHYSNDEPELMLEQFDQLVKRYPDVIDGYSGAMLACENLWRYDRAIEYGKRLLSVDSTHIATYNNLADLYKWKNDYQSGLYYSKKQLEKILQSGDEQGIASAYESVGLFYHMLGTSSKAEENLSKALEYEPQNHDAAEYMTEILLLQGKIEKAEQLMQASVSAPMQMQFKAKLYVRLANLYILTGRFSKALETLEKSRNIQFERQSTVIWSNSLIMYKIYIGLGQYRLAENDFASFTRRTLSIPDVQQSFRLKQLEFVLALENQNFQRAETLIRNDLKRKDRVNPFEIDLLMATNKSEQALELLFQRIKEDTSTVSGERLPDHYKLATIYFEQNRFSEALQSCLAALKTRRVLQGYKSIDFVRAMGMLPEIYHRMNETDKAIAACDRFLQLWENADPGTPLLVQVQNRKEQLLRTRTLQVEMEN